MEKYCTFVMSGVPGNKFSAIIEGYALEYEYVSVFKNAVKTVGAKQGYHYVY